MPKILHFNHFQKLGECIKYVKKTALNQVHSYKKPDCPENKIQVSLTSYKHMGKAGIWIIHLAYVHLTHQTDHLLLQYRLKDGLHPASVSGYLWH